MKFIHDTRDKIGKHDNVDRFMSENDFKNVRSKLLVGDVAIANNHRVCVDLKRNLEEVATNIVQQHDRFVEEMEKAREFDIQLVVLVEHSPLIQCIDDVAKWKNPRRFKSKSAIDGNRLMKSMKTIAQKYGVYWDFCYKSQTGKRLAKLLGIGTLAPVCCDRSSFEVKQLGNLPFLCCTYCGKPHHIITKEELERGI